MAGTQAFTEQLESMLSLYMLPFTSGKVVTQYLSLGCPLLRCPFILVTKIGLEIHMGRVGNKNT